MKHYNLKLTTFCLLTMGVNQFSLADNLTRQTLPLFQSKDIPALCDAKINDVKKQETSLPKNRNQQKRTAERRKSHCIREG